MKRNEEVVTSSAVLKADEMTELVNMVVTNRGHLERRKGYSTFGEMVHVLWKINQEAKKMGWSADYTVRLPLKGTKPIYKKTLKGTK